MARSTSIDLAVPLHDILFKDMFSVLTLHNCTTVVFNLSWKRPAAVVSFVYNCSKRRTQQVGQLMHDKIKILVNSCLPRRENARVGIRTIR